MKKILLSVAMLCMALGGRAETQDVCQGWPEDYGGVMLQGFWWDSYDATQWTNLTARADELSQYFDLIWIPNAGTTSTGKWALDHHYSIPNSMGYDPCYWLEYNSCFGLEEELKTMIQTYKDLNVGIIEDVVVNHKNGVSGWCDFPNEEKVVDGKEYKITWDNETYAQICKNDECNWHGYQTNGDYDTGDNFDGYRDLDHKNPTTQTNVKVYVDYLRNVMGFAGFRYDMVKGYGAGYIKDYNEYAVNQPQSQNTQQFFSVGEYWDDQTPIQNWIMNTGNTSAAFDFPLKYKINDAISGGDYSAFEWKSFSFDPNFSRYAITFADNHDSGREDHSKLKYNWSAANAFLLASPGTPCIWYPHYLADPTNIQAMIVARKDCGITNTGCTVLQQYPVKNNSGYIFETQGSKGRIYLQLGSAVDDGAPAGYTLVAQGDAYKFYSTQAGFAYVTVSPDGGPFTDATLDVTLTPVQASTAWYRVGDGETTTFTEPTTVTIGNGVDLDGDITIYWGATGSNTEYTGSKTFTKRSYYPAPSFGTNEIGVFFETDANEVYFYAWGGDLENDENWTWDNKPLMKRMGVNDDGKLVYKWTYNGTLKEMPTGLLFIPDGKQTPDMDFVNHGYYTASGLSYNLGTSTVYFDNSVSNWNHVYYYAWDNQGKCKAQWPGELISSTTTIDGHEYYKVDLDGKYTSIIFNDPEATGVKQTEDLTVVDGKVYKLGANTVYFDNSQVKWDKVYYYAYTKDELPKEKWPGEVVTTTDDRGFFKVALLDAYTTVIFNDGTTNGSQVGVNQTENLEVEDGEVYTINVAEVTSVSLPGSFNDWSTDAQGTNADNVWTWSLDLTDCETNVEFKLLVNGDKWLGYNALSLSVPKSTWVSGNGDSNITLNNSSTNYKTYLITATWTPCVSVEQGWSLKIEGVEPRYPLMTLTVAGTEALLGSNWDPTDASNDMTFCEDGTCYYLTKMAYLAAGDYEFKVVKDHSWDVSYGDSNNNNYKFYIGSPGLYEVSFYYHQSDNHLSHNVVSKDVLEIVDGEPFEAVGNLTNATVAIATYQRAFKNNWGTLCLPFEIKRAYDGVTFYQLGEVNTGENVLTFREVSSVEAGQPVVYKAEDGVALDFEEVDVAVASVAGSSDVYETGWTLHGTFTNQTGLNAPSNEFLYFIANNKFWQGIDTNIAAYRAWFTTGDDLLSGASDAPFRIAVGDTEDIQVVEQEDGSVKVYYDLQGRRLGQVRKGLVIENGKLIFVK